MTKDNIKKLEGVSDEDEKMSEKDHLKIQLDYYEMQKNLVERTVKNIQSQGYTLEAQHVSQISAGIFDAMDNRLLFHIADKLGIDLDEIFPRDYQNKLINAFVPQKQIDIQDNKLIM